MTMMPTIAAVIIISTGSRNAERNARFDSSFFCALSKRYFKKSRDTRGSPYYRGQAPYLVVTERGRQKAYYRQPSWYKPKPKKKQRRFGWVLKLGRLIRRNSTETAATR